MGRLIDQLAPEYGFTVTARVDVGREEPLAGADVAVEFSTPAAVLGNIRKVAAVRVPIVVGTTGWVEHLAEARSHHRGKRLGAGLEPELFSWRERLHAAGGGSRAAAEERKGIRRLGVGNSSHHQKRRAFRHPDQAGGANEGSGVRPRHRHQLQPRRCASRYA